MEYEFLYEIIEDYKDAASEEEKDKVFDLFCSYVWSSKNKRRTYKKSIKFFVKDDLLNTEIGQVFDKYTNLEYRMYKFATKEDSWYDLIRQKVNNLYSIYFDESIILKKDYMHALKTPKNLYYKWVNGEEFKVDELTNLINNSIDESVELYKKYQNEKMKLSWNEYKNIINVFFKKAFDNCQLLTDYEKTHKLKVPIFDMYYTEDNFYIKYICKTIDSYIRNYQKEYYNLKRGRNKKYKRCKECGDLIEIKNKKDFSTKYCNVCKQEKTKEKHRKYNKKRRSNNDDQAKINHTTLN